MTLPKTMRAVVLTGHGGMDKLEYHEDWPTPVPGPGDVVVKVAACGLNNIDINTRTAWYSKTVRDGITIEGGKGGFDTADDMTASWTNRRISFPRIQGCDVVGRIVAVGDGADPTRMGERVILNPWLLDSGDWLTQSNASFFGSECNGGYADFTVIRAENALRVETDLSDGELATLPAAMHTAEPLVAKSGLQPGETAVVTGASGGVGSMALQLCRLRGARVIAIASKVKEDLLLELGAEAVIDRNVPDLEAAIRETAGGTIEVAIDVVGGPMFMPLINALRQGGRYSTSGAIAGPVVEFDLRQLIYKDLQMTGATITPPGTLVRLVKLVECGAIKPILAHTFPLSEFVKAQELFMLKKHVGSIIVTME